MTLGHLSHHLWHKRQQATSLPKPKTTAPTYRDLRPLLILHFVFGNFAALLAFIHEMNKRHANEGGEKTREVGREAFGEARCLCLLEDDVREPVAESEENGLRQACD
jgi:hypothetical protein